MKLSDFDFTLPTELIAQYPPKNRTDSRLLHVRADALVDMQFSEIADLFRENDLLVRNNVRVIKARFFGEKQTGGKLEFLFERVLGANRVLTQIKASRSPSAGDKLIIADRQARVLGKQGFFYEIELLLGQDESIEMFTERNGHLPLPPYINRADEDFDEQRYQTVFAKTPGAVAAPTAGLHFDENTFEKLRMKGVSIADITLYVGSGTFQPVRTETVKDHVMHAERYELTTDLVEKIKACRQKGGRVIALGTTSLRTLEAASLRGELEAHSGETDIFIYPGFKFKCVDALITNFHLPKSTLLMLVSAFSGLETVRKAYSHAVEQKYRFFSYGDAMFLEAREKAQ